MGVEEAERVLAIDGGGSGSRLALVDNGQRYQVAAGPANVSTDFGGAIAALRAGLEALAETADWPVSELCALPAYLGLAGVVGPNDAVQVAHALPLTTARIESDQAATVEGALAGRDGAVAGLGTGSFFGISTGGTLRLAGGWGHRIDDRASGFWLGREALRAALMTEDGRAQPGQLSQTIMARFGTPHAIVAFARDAGPEDIAGLAATVVETAEAGDNTAQMILSRGADHVLASLSAIGWQKEVPLCLIGGVAKAYAPYLQGEAQLIPPSGPALEGAIARARRFAEGRL